MGLGRGIVVGRGLGRVVGAVEAKRRKGWVRTRRLGCEGGVAGQCAERSQRVEVGAIVTAVSQEVWAKVDWLT